MIVKICCVCENENTRYKCPKCKQFYCSVICCNKHKENCNAQIESQATIIKEDVTGNINLEYNFSTEDTVPIEKLEQLRYSKEVKDCLKNQQIKDIITNVLKNKDPTKAIAKAMTESVFVEFADACLKIVEPPDEDKPC